MPVAPALPASVPTPVVQAPVLVQAPVPASTPIAASAPPRTTTVIQYFAKSADPKGVEAALRELGFEPSTPEAPIPSRPSNTIWFGSAVPRAEYQSVATALIHARVRLRAMCLFRQSPKKDSRMIEIGYSSLAAGAEPYTVERVQREKTFECPVSAGTVGKRGAGSSAGWRKGDPAYDGGGSTK